VLLSLFAIFIQLPCLCKFASNEFYDGRLRTSPTVERRYSAKLERLQGFWPRGPRKPFVFCNVVGSEDENNGARQDGTAPVGVESKRNNKEAKKIVSLSILCRIIICTHDILL
jgi:superfamily I DNA and/or RNA helicase